MMAIREVLDTREKVVKIEIIDDDGLGTRWCRGMFVPLQPNLPHATTNN